MTIVVSKVKIFRLFFNFSKVCASAWCYSYEILSLYWNPSFRVACVPAKTTCNAGELFSSRLSISRRHVNNVWTVYPLQLEKTEDENLHQTKMHISRVSRRQNPSIAEGPTLFHEFRYLGLVVGFQVSAFHLQGFCEKTHRWRPNFVRQQQLSWYFGPLQFSCEYFVVKITRVLTFTESHNVLKDSLFDCFVLAEGFPIIRVHSKLRLIDSFVNSPVSLVE